MHRVTIALLVIATGSAFASDKPIPKPAARIVAAVHAAASTSDTISLRSLMASDFISSFGGDGGPKEALGLWTSDRTYLQHLAEITAGACQLQSPRYVECPPHAGIGYRAGFKLIDGRWVFASFVAGD